MKVSIYKVACSLGIVVFCLVFFYWIAGFGGSIHDHLRMMMFIGMICFVLLLLLWSKEFRAHRNSKKYKKKMATLVPSKFKKMFIWKSYWAKHVYADICVAYLAKNSTRTIPMMEDVLFLMQYESLKKLNTPLLYYKIHIDKDSVKAPFVSDFLKVREVKYMNLNYSGKGSLFIPHYSKYMNVYKPMLRKYKKMSAEELREQVKTIEAQEELNPKHFIQKPYHSKRFLMKARSEVFFEDHFVKAIFYLFFGVIGILLPFIAVPIVIIWFFIRDVAVVSAWEILFAFFLYALPWYIWTYYKFQEPTDFEKRK